MLCNNSEITACIADLFNSFYGSIFQASAATNFTGWAKLSGATFHFCL